MGDSPEVVHIEAKDDECSEIESLCVQCFKQGTTRLLLKKIPHFEDVIVSSFECPHCGNANKDFKSAATRQEMGSLHVLKVNCKKDLDRQIVKSDFATVTLNDINFEIPPNTQKGVCSTIEGIIMQATTALEQGQIVRRYTDPELAEKLDGVIANLKDCASGKRLPFTVSLTDPSGNSSIENLMAPVADPQLHVSYFKASDKQLNAMGHFAPEVGTPKETKIGADIPEHLRIVNTWNLEESMEANIARNGSNQEAMIFSVPCPHCNAMGKNQMCQINVPGFRQCIIMAFVCDNCGVKENEVRPSGAYGEKGCRWELSVRDEKDMNRDFLKSDTAGMIIPSISFEMLTGIRGGLFTTVEGMLSRLVEELRKCHPFDTGDSAKSDTKSAYDRTIQHIEKLVKDPTQMPFGIVLDDPADHSFIGHRDPLKPDDPDSHLKKAYYTRSRDQDDELGLLDLKTENYETPEPAPNPIMGDTAKE